MVRVTNPQQRSMPGDISPETAAFVTTPEIIPASSSIEPTDMNGGVAGNFIEQPDPTDSARQSLEDITAAEHWRAVDQFTANIVAARQAADSHEYSLYA